MGIVKFMYFKIKYALQTFKFGSANIINLTKVQEIIEYYVFTAVYY